jgi:putative holliday junction resolvase
LLTIHRSGYQQLQKVPIKLLLYLSRKITINNEKTYIGLDIGQSRIGVARIHSVAMIAEPLQVIDTKKQDVTQMIQRLVLEYQSDGIVVGLPRGLDGQETAQTQYCRDFALQLKKHLAVPVYMIDEAGTSQEADQRLASNSMVSRDSMAAAILLEDFARHKKMKDLEV